VGVELEHGLVEEGLSERVTALTEKSIGRCMELVLQVGEVDVGFVVLEVVLVNLMGGLIIQILERVDLGGVVEQLLVVLRAVEIKGVVVAGLGRLAAVCIPGARYPFFVLLDVLGIETGQLGSMLSINPMRTAEAFQRIGILLNVVALDTDLAFGADEVIP